MYLCRIDSKFFLFGFQMFLHHFLWIFFTIFCPYMCEQYLSNMHSAPNIFDSINVNLMTFIWTETHFGIGCLKLRTEQAELRSESEKKSQNYRVKSLLFLCVFSPWTCDVVRRHVSSCCYHIIIRLKNNKNKSLMCFVSLCYPIPMISCDAECSVEAVALIFFPHSFRNHFLSFVLLIAGVTTYNAIDVHRHAMNWCESKAKPQSEYQKTGKRKSMALNGKKWMREKEKEREFNVLDILKWASAEKKEKLYESWPQPLP